MRILRSHRVFAPLFLLAVAALLRSEACSPKIKAVFTGGSKPTIKTSKLKSNQPGNDGSKSLGKKLGLSRGGEAMDRVDSKKAYKARMKEVRADIKLARAVNKAEIKGKPLKGWAKKAQEAADARKAAQRAAQPPPGGKKVMIAGQPAQSAESLVEKMNKLKAETAAKRSTKKSEGTTITMVADVHAPPPPPPLPANFKVPPRKPVKSLKTAKKSGGTATATDVAPPPPPPLPANFRRRGRNRNR